MIPQEHKDRIKNHLIKNTYSVDGKVWYKKIKIQSVLLTNRNDLTTLKEKVAGLEDLLKSIDATVAEIRKIQGA